MCDCRCANHCLACPGHRFQLQLFLPSWDRPRGDAVAEFQPRHKLPLFTRHIGYLKREAIIINIDQWCWFLLIKKKVIRGTNEIPYLIQEGQISWTWKKEQFFSKHRWPRNRTAAVATTTTSATQMFLLSKRTFDCQWFGLPIPIFSYTHLPVPFSHNESSRSCHVIRLAIGHSPRSSSFISSILVFRIWKGTSRTFNCVISVKFDDQWMLSDSMIEVTRGTTGQKQGYDIHQKQSLHFLFCLIEV